MAKKKTKNQPKKKQVNAENVIGLHSEVTDQPITQTLEVNYMPYAMSVNVSRAFPEIDGFKPSHRKLLYTMYKMGLLKGERQKSANIVGQTMKLNPHGDAAIYETMVRLATGNEALLAPFVESKGNFGKYYSGDLSYAASRYTEAKLSPISAEIFKDIDKDPVDFVDSYDGAMKEPRLLPTTFPNILVSANKGIGVAMASDICGFNLNEVCTATMHYLQDPDCDLLEYMPMPDFSTGGEIIYRREEMEKIIETGLGSFQIRSRWRWIPEERIIEVYEIPYTTKTDVIIERIVKLSKEGKVKEIADIRDETDLSGLRIAIDLKRGVDPDKLMAKLYRSTTLQDSFSCNFNVLVDGYPRVMGVRQILHEWVKWRIESTRRRINFDLGKKSERLHLLHGLEAILLDIDKAIAIIRNTEREADVVPNLMDGFGIDRIQAEYIAEIKLRNLNREYIINRIKDIQSLQEGIADLELTIGSDTRIKNLIASQLKTIRTKYGKPRLTQLIGAEEITKYREEEFVENYNVKLIFTKEGYFKKITLLSYRGNDEQKLKEGDRVIFCGDASNNDELLFFSDRAQVYKAKVSDFDTVKASQLGDYIPAKLGFDDDERAIAMKPVPDYEKSGYAAVFFENGKGVRIPVSMYETKTNRKKLTNAYSGASAPVGVVFTDSDDSEILLVSDQNKAILIRSGLVPEKATRTSQGIQLMTLKKGGRLISASADGAALLSDAKKYRKNKLQSISKIKTCCYKCFGKFCDGHAKCCKGNSHHEYHRDPEHAALTFCFL